MGKLGLICLLSIGLVGVILIFTESTLGDEVSASDETSSDEDKRDYEYLEARGNFEVVEDILPDPTHSTETIDSSYER